MKDFWALTILKYLHLLCDIFIYIFLYKLTKNKDKTKMWLMLFSAFFFLLILLQYIHICAATFQSFKFLSSTCWNPFSALKKYFFGLSL